MKHETESVALTWGGTMEEWEALKQQGSDHYKTGGCEPIDLYLAGHMFFDHALCSIIKYAFRSRVEARVDKETFIRNMDKIIDFAQKLKAGSDYPKAGE